MKILTFLFLITSFAHSDESVDLKPLLGYFSKEHKQTGTLILTPTDETNNEVDTEFADAQIVVGQQSFQIVQPSLKI